LEVGMAGSKASAGAGKGSHRWHGCSSETGDKQLPGGCVRSINYGCEGHQTPRSDFQLKDRKQVLLAKQSRRVNGKYRWSIKPKEKQ
jgi:hypothetical protein